MRNVPIDDRSDGSSSATVSRARDTYRALCHLDLTGQVEQAETRPRGGGGFSMVFYGLYKPPGKVVNVAIKRMRVDLPEDDYRQGRIAKAVAAELKIWSTLVHPNIHKLLGFIVDRGSYPASVAEWMDNGTILNYVNANGQADILYLVRGIASGLAYLHQAKVVHADLKSDNILISSDGAPLLTDFGISRTLIVTHTPTGARILMGSIRWMATELVNPGGFCRNDLEEEDRTLVNDSDIVQTKETDVWAFGMVVYELLTRNVPFFGKTEMQAMFLIAAGKLPLTPKEMEKRPAFHRSLWELCKSCCEKDPDDRPQIEHIVNDLRKQPFIYKNPRSQQRRIDGNGLGDRHTPVLNGVTEHRPASHRSYSSNSTAIGGPENHSSSTGSASHETTTQPQLTNYAPQEYREDLRTGTRQPQPPYPHVGGGLTHQESRRGQDNAANIAVEGNPMRPNPHPAPMGNYSLPPEDPTFGQSGRSSRPTQDYATSNSPPTSYSYFTPSLLLSPQSGSHNNATSGTHPAIGVDRMTSIDRYRNHQPHLTPLQPHVAPSQSQHAQTDLPSMDRKASERGGEVAPYTAQTRKILSESQGKDLSYGNTHNPTNPLPITKHPSQRQDMVTALAPLASALSQRPDSSSSSNPVVHYLAGDDGNLQREYSLRIPKSMKSNPSQAPEQKQTFEPHDVTTGPEPDFFELASSHIASEVRIGNDSKMPIGSNLKSSKHTEEDPAMTEWRQVIHQTERFAGPTSESIPPFHTACPYTTPPLPLSLQQGRHTNSTRSSSAQMSDASSNDRPVGLSSIITRRARDVYQALGHLDLSGQVQQTETWQRVKGGFSSVYYGTYQSRGKIVNVAIKRMRVLPDDNDREGRIAKMVARELKIWSALNHPNVLPILGFIVDGDNFPALVSEWMDNGTILNYVQVHRQTDIFQLVEGVASGLAYLHQVKVVHADLRSDNILISLDGTPLLADFGISRTLVVTQTVNGVKGLMGSVRWMAPELLNPGGYSLNDPNMNDMALVNDSWVVQTRETDVWAFGMVVHELLTGAYPFDGLSDMQAMFRIAEAKQPRNPTDLDVSPFRQLLWELCKMCWEKDPDDRPQMKNIVAGLKDKTFIYRNCHPGSRHAETNYSVTLVGDPIGQHGRPPRPTHENASSNPTSGPDPNVATPFLRTQPSSRDFNTSTRTCPGSAGRTTLSDRYHNPHPHAGPHDLSLSRTASPVDGKTSKLGDESAPELPPTPATPLENTTKVRSHSTIHFSTRLGRHHVLRGLMTPD